MAPPWLVALWMIFTSKAGSSGRIFSTSFSISAHQAVDRPGDLPYRACGDRHFNMAAHLLFGQSLDQACFWSKDLRLPQASSGPGPAGAGPVIEEIGWKGYGIESSAEALISDGDGSSLPHYGPSGTARSSSCAIIIRIRSSDGSSLALNLSSVSSMTVIYPLAVV